MKFAEHIIVNGKVDLYKEKAPFAKSGKSLRGALEYNPTIDKIKCHECGKWFRSFSIHLKTDHATTAREYKRKHGFWQKTALVSEGVRQAFIAAEEKRRIANPNLYKANIERLKLARIKGAKQVRRRLMTTEGMNVEYTCPDQVLRRVKEVAKIVGHTPTVIELRAHGITPSLLRFRFKTIGRAMKLANLTPNRVRKDGGGGIRMHPVYNNDQLLEFIRTFVEVNGRLPYQSDSRRGILPSRPTYINRFGSWGEAVKQAGYSKLFAKAEATGFGAFLRRKYGRSFHQPKSNRGRARNLPIPASVAQAASRRKH